MTRVTDRLEGLLAQLREALPSGDLLPEDVWMRRHRVIMAILWLHVPPLFIFGLVQALDLLHIAAEVSLVAIPAIVARWARLPRMALASVATFGLVSASAILIHFSGGYIELHFHFFVVLGLITLYQNWVPFLLALSYVVLHHGVIGTLQAGSVYNTPDAIAHPWKWAFIHGAFVLAASGAYIAAWRLTEHQALHDQLTQLPNRALFRDRLDQLSARVSRAGAAGTAGAVLFVDIDDFKSVNDTLGHDQGDRLIVAIGVRLAGVLRKSDTIARLGGDEFGIVIDNVGSTADIDVVAGRVLRAFAEPFSLAGRDMPVSASVGAVRVGAERRTADDLVRDADTAMYRAKKGGKDRYVVFEPAEPSAPLGAVGA
jgi:diguanylate cyclase (GGDEF)-like protein